MWTIRPQQGLRVSSERKDTSRAYWTSRARTWGVSALPHTMRFLVYVPRVCRPRHIDRRQSKTVMRAHNSEVVSHISQWTQRYSGVRERQGRAEDTAGGAGTLDAGRRCTSPGVVERAAAFRSIAGHGYTVVLKHSVINPLDVLTYVLAAPLPGYLSQAHLRRSIPISPLLSPITT